MLVQKKKLWLLIKQALLRSNVKVFLVCILVGFVLWLYNDLYKQTSYVLDYPIQIMFDTDKYIMEKPIPKNIKIEIKGTGWKIFKQIWQAQNNPIKYNLTPPFPLFFVKENLRKQALLSISEVSVLDVFSDSIRVEIDRKIKQIVEIKVDTSYIELKEGYQIKDIKISPERIAFTGSEKLMRYVNNPYIIQITQKNVNTSIKKEFEINIPQDTLNAIKKDEEKVKIFIEIIKKNKNE
jgi:YbbR domain-containing protein